MTADTGLFLSKQIVEAARGPIVFSGAGAHERSKVYR
jgi:hypothetical protein